MNQLVIVVDFGAQYSQVIARKIRECNVYCEVVPWKITLDEIKRKNPIGIVLSGGPSSVYEEGAPTIDKGIFNLNVPILGICYGMQLMVHLLGGNVIPAQDDKCREYGKTITEFDTNCNIFKGLPRTSVTWMSHGDFVESIPAGFDISATTKNCKTAGICNENRRLYGLQFHPEVEHSEYGKDILRKFLVDVCGTVGDWSMKNFLNETIAALKEKIGNDKVLLGLSGGVDSTVAAVVLSKAIGKNLICIYIDHGLMRKNETQEIINRYKKLDLNFYPVDASEEFLSALKGVTDPEEKRHIIGKKFVDVFARKAAEFKGIPYLAQGTIYPDIIESGALNGNLIKSHHNVGGLPKDIGFNGVIEPLRILFKDEVRKLGLQMGLEKEFVFRQPFPGPGLAVRIIGEITKEKVEILQNADAIVRETFKSHHYQYKSSQYFAVLTNIKSVGVMGDGRTYSYAVAIRSVSTNDFMTANYVKLPYNLLDEISRRIVNEVTGVNRVLYDITSKPPSTIEYE